jgi:hypothetical protein
MTVKKVLQRIAAEKRGLEKNQKINRNLGIIVFIIIATTLAYLNLSMMMNLITISQLALIVEIGAILLVLILIMQYVSLRGEIAKITMGLENLETYNEIFSNKIEFPTRKQHVELYGKIFDVKKNTIDKLFDKLKTFSNTWLAVAGGLFSTVLIEIFKSSTIEPYSILVISVTVLLVFDAAQNLYGGLNYELVKKTKDLAFWWIALV